MPIRDNKSRNEALILYSDIISANGDYFTPSIQIKRYPNGVTFIPFLIDDGVTVQITQVQSSTDNANWQPLTSFEIIGQLPTLVDETQNETPLPTFGILETNLYVRFAYTVSNYSQNSRFVVIVNGGLEVAPSEFTQDIVDGYDYYIDSEENPYVDVNGDNYVSVFS